ncbi:hypothetical protein [Nocardioides sp. NPDC047086]|uniref:hypothetical protein n=1 Tax=Nocardioides sp. NPDC047086 TaxID=3154810 RepID=UPI0033E40B06
MLRQPVKPRPRLSKTMTMAMTAGFGGLFGGDDDSSGEGADEDDLARAPVAKGSAVKDRKHKSTFGHAPKYDPKAKRVKELTSKRSESARYWRLSDGRTRPTHVAASDRKV